MRYQLERVMWGLRAWLAGHTLACILEREPSDDCPRCREDYGPPGWSEGG